MEKGRRISSAKERKKRVSAGSKPKATVSDFQYWGGLLKKRAGLCRNAPGEEGRSQGDLDRV